MVALLVHAHDNVGATVFQTSKRPQRGDVCRVEADGFAWGEKELISPAYRILHWPSETAAGAAALLGWEVPTVALAHLETSGDLSNTLQYRGFCLSVALMPADLQAYMADDTRAAAAFDVPATVTIASLKTRKAAIANPNVLGADTVLGP